ncbi:MAG TPA: nuclear transport factor 2 family protein [Solirubrobacteraceae bacterium]
MATSELSPRPALAQVPQWVREHYALVDAADVDRYVEAFTEDVELRFGSHPPVRGRAAVRDALAAGHAEHAMAHTVVGCWESGDTTILEFDVVYTYADGYAQRAPSVALIRRNDAGLTTSLRVYVQKPR